MLSEDADAHSACRNLAEYSRRELIPLIITDVPRDEIEFLCSVFPHIDAYTYEDDDDTFFGTEADFEDEVDDLGFDDENL